jgi:3-deoxy-D-manno-octulosonic-acid transferase
VHCTGNLKFDLAAALPETRLDALALLRGAEFSQEGIKIVAGSTHAGEEALLARVFLRLRGDFPGLGLILVPRHMERAETVEAELRRIGLPCIRRSTLGAERLKGSAAECLLVDSTGELPDFYRVADVVFIGKSLRGRGGQNPIEPAALGKSVLAGPNMQNFRDVARLLEEGGGLVRVADEQALTRELRRQLADGAYRQKCGESARAVVLKNTGSLRSTREKCVLQLMGGNNIENPG